MMRCPNSKCKFTFCFNCKEDWHTGFTCAQFQKWKVENSGSEGAFIKWREKNTRPCPNCNVSIEKNAGCNHMTCFSCKYNFCWLCLQKYTTKHFGPKSKCKQFS